jgi:AraC-like DNA-binding protein
MKRPNLSQNMANRSAKGRSRITSVARRNQIALMAPRTAPYDLLTDVMEQIRLEATVYFVLESRSPCAISIARPGRSPFYAVTAGTCTLVHGRKVYQLRDGDFVLIPSGAPHVMRGATDAPIVELDEWMRLHPKNESGYIRIDGPAPPLCITGGFFSFAALKANPMFDVLPPVIHLRGDDPHVQEWLQPTLRFIHAEIACGHQGSQTVLRRMADVLFIQAVRAYAAQHACAASWLRGLSDARVSKALSLLHERYAEPWSLDSLAREIGTSRTVLAVRFKELVGEAPMTYLARWRITRAANQMRQERISLSRLAESVGYGSDAVFSKAFRRITGQSPGQYRRAAAS